MHGFPRDARLAIALLCVVAIGGCTRAVPEPAFRPRSTVAAPPILSGAPLEAPLALSASPRIASFNVYMPGSVKDLEARYAAVRDQKMLASTDVWLLQEIETLDVGSVNAAQWLGERLGLYWAFASTRSTSDGDLHGLAILSRYPIRDLERLWLPHFDLAWHSRDRAALAATIEFPFGNVRVYNVHLDTKLNFDERAVQIDPVLQQASLYPAAVVGGDFNTNNFIWIARAFPFGFDRQAKRLDALMAEHGFAAPLADAGGTATLGLRLDGIYVRGLDTRAAAVHEERGESDHRPISVVLEAR
jgi:endonuclease/exonuclease/phosphatase family metal-dependent hydrolase